MKGRPTSQSRQLLLEKQQLAERLLRQGLTITQICRQLSCSPGFIRQVRDRIREEDAERIPA